MKSYFFLCLLLINSVFVIAQDSVTTVILVRHAEKVQDGSANPDLTKAGELRAIELAYMLRAEAIAGVFSTDYTRTIKTAAPTATFHELPILKYAHKSQDVFADNLLAKYRGQKVLVVGHSNSVPELISILTGKPIDNIEHHVYNDLFVVTLVNKGEGTLLHLKFGEMSVPPLRVNTTQDRVGVQGYDVVAYHKEGKAVKGNKYISTTYEGVTYYFSSQKYLIIFSEQPTAYLPKYGGWCAYGFVNNENTQHEVNPELFKVIDNELYLFRNATDLEQWNAQSDKKNIKKATENWKRLNLE